MPSHRAGAFKQSNKKHSTGRHRSKGAINTDNRGKKNDVPITKGGGVHKVSKAERRNKMVQKRKLRTKAVVMQKEALIGHMAPPICTTILSFDEEHVAAAGLLRSLMQCSDGIHVNSPQQLVHYVNVPRMKMRFCFVTPSADEDEMAVLDAIKVSDSVLIIWPLEEALSDHKQHLLSCILAQGVPLVVPVVRGLCTLNGKHAQQTTRNLHKELQLNCLDAKLAVVDTDSDAMNVLRRLHTAKRQPTNLQRHRPHLLIDNVQPIEDSTNTDSVMCTVQVSGYVRGRCLDVNSLLHIAGWGTFQMAQIDVQLKTQSMSEWTVLCQADAQLQTSLDTGVQPDHMATEQTWPTEHELHNAQTERKRKRVPEGTSEYQATWIPDEPDSDEEEDNDDSDDAMADHIQPHTDQSHSDIDSDNDSDSDNDQQMDTMSVAPSDFDVVTDNGLDEQQLAMFRQQRENEMFPDEVDTPIDQAARVRFQKYRGLKSFRTSPWDAKENLPLDYATIFQFENFKRSRKRALVEATQGAQPGAYVRVHLQQVPRSVLDQSESSVLTAYGLLQHEQRVGVVNVTVSATQGQQLRLKSKQPVLVQIGFRRLIVRPIYSEHTLGDKHKFLRWMPEEGTCVATFYAPISYPPATVLLMSPENGQLLGTGAVMDTNADRVVLKRILLSGHPYRVHSKSVVVRFMFFTRDDVAWFKPVELRTKYGRRGHITESLGTHGLFKCRLDGKVTQQDTVLMHLYKRMFPKMQSDVFSTTASVLTN